MHIAGLGLNVAHLLSSRASTQPEPWTLRPKAILLPSLRFSSGFGGPTYAAERAPSEEERIAPLVSKQNWWGRVVKYVSETHKFEVEDALCADGSFYHLHFDDDLKLVEGSSEKHWPGEFCGFGGN
jgi:hypothetical protein